MVIFNSYVKLPEGNMEGFSHGKSTQQIDDLIWEYPKC